MKTAMRCFLGVCVMALAGATSASAGELDGRWRNGFWTDTDKGHEDALRGRFRQVTHVNVDMLLTSRRHFRQDPEVDKNKIEMLTELTLSLPLLVFFTNKHEYKWKDL